MRSLVALIALALLAALHSTPSLAAKRVALVVGNSGYERIPALKNPKNDAALMARALQDVGFEVIHVSDVELRGLGRAVKKFGRALAAAGPRAVGLFYYAGHGVQSRGENYLIPLRAEVDREVDLGVEAMSASQILSQMEAAGNALNLIILDACRNNPYEQGFRSISRGLTRVNAPRGSLMAFAAAPGQVAADGDGANSPYTKALVKAMKVPGLPVEQTFKRVLIEVEDTTGRAQTPWVESSLRGDFFFVPPGAQPPKSEETETAVLKLPKKKMPPPAPDYGVGEVFRDCPNCPEMVVVPAGTYTNGSPRSEKGRTFAEDQLQVTIPKPFAVGKFEVTVAEFGAFVKATGHRMGNDCTVLGRRARSVGKPRNWRKTGFKQTGDHPVVCLIWNDAKAYVRWLSKKTGERYRLLTSDEWEFAARAETEGPFYHGQYITTDQANFDGAFRYNGSRKGKFRRGTIPVGSFPPNKYGLHDMHGNAGEMVEGCIHPGHCDPNAHIQRGGSWSSKPMFVRSAWELRVLSHFRTSNSGFRVARDL